MLNRSSKLYLLLVILAGGIVAVAGLFLQMVGIPKAVVGVLVFLIGMGLGFSLAVINEPR